MVGGIAARICPLLPLANACIAPCLSFTGLAAPFNGEAGTLVVSLSSWVDQLVDRLLHQVDEEKA